MKLSDRYEGASDPFEGDRALVLKTIPVGARIRSARATVTPVDGTRGANPFAETISFNRTTGGWGATKTTVAARWVEVDFHARRTLAGVAGVNLEQTTLQVDLGGAYVEINTSGGIKTPSDANPFIIGNTEALPGLNVTKLKLTNNPANPSIITSPDISRVTVRSTPTNVSLRLGELPVFWTYAGEMTRPETVPDFALVINAALATAQSENGFYILPLVLHSDTIARLNVELEMEFSSEQSVLPEGLTEIVLPFDLSGTTPSEQQLQIDIPPNKRLSVEGTAARVTGVFDETRLVPETDTPAPAPDEVELSLEVSPEISQAQPVKLTNEVLATDIDLFVMLTTTVRLQLDLRDDLDGKPAQASLLPVPVEVEVTGPAGTGEDTKDVKAQWVSIKLPSVFKFKAGATYWLVLQSLEGEVGWRTRSAPGAELSVQRTNDGGLSWRAAEAGRVSGPLKAFFHLRQRPRRFEMPIRLRVGEGAKAVEVDLKRFESLGRVDFALEAQDLAGAVNKFLEQGGARDCPQVEHLSNGDFEEWLRVGDTLWPPVPIPLASPPLSVGIAPDGSWGYVGQSAAQKGVLRIFDVACNVLRDEDVQLELTPQRLLMSPDGLHAYACGDTRIQLIDTSLHQTIGTPFDPGVDITGQQSSAIEAVTLSGDGGRLYVIETYFQMGDDVTAVAATRRELHVLDTFKLAQALESGQADLKDARIITAPLDRLPPVKAIAVTPDETRLLAAAIITGTTPRGSLHVLDLSDLSLEGETVPLGQSPVALAVSPDGDQVLVTDQTDNNLTFVALSNIARGDSSKAIKTLSLAPFPIDVAITADRQRAYVVGVDTLSYIDLSALAVVKTQQLGESLLGLAVTPQGDRLYIPAAPISADHTRRDALYSIQIGSRQPVEWNVTSGQVAPLCQPEPFRQIALLGSPPGSATQLPLNVHTQMTTAISQLVPVLEKCSYDFSFYGISSEVGALAEVFWLGSDCRPVQPNPDEVLIEELRMPGVRVSAAAAATRASRLIAESAPLVLHRRRLTAPAGAVQAEVRFTIPAGVVGAIESVSLFGTTEAIQNSDLMQQQEGRLLDWQMNPATATGFALAEVESGVRLRNAGTNSVELIQAVPTKGAANFELELQGQSELRSPDGTKPRLEIYWLSAEGETVATPVSVELLPTGFGAAAAVGKIPNGVDRAELHLVVPPGATQTVKRVSLRFPSTQSVPVTFYAQAPGELTLLDWRVAYEGAKIEAPELPAGGLCPPTPPGLQPGGTTAGGDTHFCPSCQGVQALVGSEPVKTRSGRPATASRCSNCNSEVVRFGGSGNVSAAPLLNRRQPLVTRSILHVSRLRGNTALGASVNTVAAAPAQPFALIKGIAETRTQDLKALGIDSIEVLAAARPEDVALVKSIPLKLAQDFINQAKKLLSFKVSST
ncbi:MAG TPA: hypothetical protein VF708_09365 [Pyrinomonadaceae bacterium]|jgi:DNA-binding beta-propeller fold protein YncE